MSAKQNNNNSKRRSRRHNDPDSIISYDLYGDFVNNQTVSQRLTKTATSGSPYERVNVVLDTACK